MIIAVPIEKKDLNAEVYISFGRAPMFLLFDSVSQKADYIENTAAASPGGAGIKAAQLVADSGAEALLTPRCGENAAEVMAKAEIKLYKTQAGSVEKNLLAFKNGELAELQETHPGFHGHGG